MAIAYLTNIDLNNNQLKGFKVDNQTSDPTGLAGEGQMIYRTDTNELKYHTGSNTWETITVSSGTVTSVNISSATGTITVGGGPITDAGTLTVNLPVTGVTAGSYTSADITVDTYGRITAASSSGGGTMTSWRLTGDSGTSASVTNNDLVTIQGGTYITTSANGFIVDVEHDATTRTDSASTQSANTFAVVNSVTTNGTGHVTGIDVKTVTVPDNNTTSLPVKNSAGTTQFTSTQSTGVRFTGSGATSVAFTPASQLITISSTDNNETYTLPVSAGTAVSGHTVADFNLTAGGTGSGIKSRVTVAGKNDNILITETTGNNGVVKIALTNNVTIADSLTVTQDVQVNNDLSVSGSGAFTGQVTVPTANTGTSAPNLAQVELLIAGVGVFQGAYNASTNTPKLSGATNVALNLGDYFVVSVAGNNGGYFANLEPGDFIFANADIAAGSSPAASAYTVVQADANIAGSGTTDGNTQKGVSGFDSANFTVSANGWVQLNNQGTTGNYGDANETVTLAINADGIVTSASEQAIAITASQVTDFCTAVDACVADNGVTANIGDGTATAYVINHNLSTRNVIVSCYRNSSPYDTVYMEVERTSTSAVTLRTTTALASNEISVIITKVT